jgi:hypothetical protein
MAGPSARITNQPGGFTPHEAEHSTAKEADLPEWILVADHIIDRLPTVAGRLGAIKLGPGGHILALWIVLGAAIVGGVMHIIGDGSLRSKVDRTECHVEWLVERAVAEDRGEPAPPFSPLGCRQ